MYIILTVSLLATIPWFFTEFRAVHIFGFPPWAFYSLCLTIVYAIVVAFFVGRYWSVSINKNDDDQ
ncbi:MAG: hypothetical protein ACUZ8E_14280 [Candidatus Anammoxibacter sp.]